MKNCDRLYKSIFTFLYLFLSLYSISCFAEQFTAKQLLDKGISNFEEGKYQDAVANLKKAIEKLPNNVPDETRNMCAQRAAQQQLLSENDESGQKHPICDNPNIIDSGTVKANYWNAQFYIALSYYMQGNEIFNNDIVVALNEAKRINPTQRPNSEIFSKKIARFYDYPDELLKKESAPPPPSNKLNWKWIALGVGAAVAAAASAQGGDDGGATSGPGGPDSVVVTW